jgi:Predicted flavoprotein involved in K+ transport
MSNFQHPKIPSFAKELDPGLVQIHSFNYKNLSQLQEGPVLVVGAGNSGAEIALEAAKEHPVLLSGRDNGHVPFNIEGRMAKLFLIDFVFRFVFHRVLTTVHSLEEKPGQKQYQWAVHLYVLNQGNFLLRALNEYHE